MIGFDPMYFVFLAPGLALAGWATWYTKHTFNKYARTGVASGMTGAESARRMLNSQGLQAVELERVGGFLSDHYDPRSRVLRLSPAVYDQPSLSAIGVACHEAGHALQHAKGYAPLKLRTAIVPAVGFSSRFSYIVFLGGALLNSPGLLQIGVILFAASVVFALVTLPVEWDATARAKVHMVSAGIVTPAEQVHAGRVLNAAFMTYVASAVTAILTFLYYFLRSRR